MKAIRFLNTAEKLKEKTPEEDARTSISRSYYAIFHLFMEMLRREKVEILKTREKHKLHNIFYNCEKDTVRAIGSQISTLHDARIKADYKLTEKLKKIHARQFYKIARKTEEDITSLFNSPEKENVVQQSRIFFGVGRS